LKYLADFREHFSKKVVFTITDAKIFLSQKKISENYLYLLIHNLLKKKEIIKLSRGIYSFRKELLVAGFAFNPFYYGLQEALSLNGIWEQETIPIIITPRKTRTGIRKVLDSNILVRRIDRKMFFGFEFIKYYDFFIPVSLSEKTLIDFAYFNEPISKEVINELKKKIDEKTLKEFLKKCSKRVNLKVSNFLKKN